MARPLSVRLLALPIAALLGACDRPAPGPAADASAATLPSPPLAPAPRMAVAGEAAFDLALTADGALLAWAERRGNLSEIKTLRHGRDGVARGDPTVIGVALEGRPVAEIAAASSPKLLAVAWIEHRTPVGVARAALGDAVLGTFAKPELEMAATVGSLGRRGSLALSSDGERLVAFVRGEPEACPDDRGARCTRFAFSELAGQSPRPRRIPLNVPAPCANAIAGFVLLAGRWHYAVCSTASGRELTTTFRIQYEPRYAEAHEVLAGCTPAGATTVGDAVIVAADCADGRRAVRITTADSVPAKLDLSRSAISCSLGHPVIAPLALRLSEPKDGLAAVLPAEVAPAGARAVWTGTTLLVARYIAGSVTVHRFGCQRGDWARLSS